MKCRNSRLASLYECVYWNVNGYNVNLSGFCKYSEFVVRQCSVYLEDFALTIIWTAQWGIKDRLRTSRSIEHKRQQTSPSTSKWYCDLIMLNLQFIIQLESLNFKVRLLAVPRHVHVCSYSHTHDLNAADVIISNYL